MQNLHQVYNFCLLNCSDMYEQDVELSALNYPPYPLPSTPDT